MEDVKNSEHKCEQCNKIFSSEDALNQHNLAKHSVKEKVKINFRLGKILPILVVLIVAVGVYFLATRPGPEIKIVESDHVKGTGSIEIIEYSDFQCPACGSAYPTLKKFMEQFGDKVKFAYRHFPLPNHQFALKAAEASECAADQNKFWEFHNKLFENQNSLAIPDLKKYAQELGLNTEEFNSCLDSYKTVSRVTSDFSEGQTLEVGATPTLFINKKKYEGAMTFEELKQSTGLV